MATMVAAITAETPPPRTSVDAVELLTTGVRIHELNVPRKSVADYLRELPQDERESHVVEALEVGIFCLERAVAVRDLDFIRSQVTAILDDVERKVDGIPAAIESTLAARLRSEDSGMLAPIRTMVELATQTMTERVNGVKELLSNDIDPAKSTSTLGRALGQMKDLLDPSRKDSIQA